MKYFLTSFLCMFLVFLLGTEFAYAQPLPGQIMVDPENPARLFRKGQGSFFLVASDSPEGFLYRGHRNTDGTHNGDQMQIINRLAESGINGLYLMAIRSHGGDGGPNENPFNDSKDPDSGLNLNILDQWEKWFTAMDRQGIVIYFVFYDDSAAPFGGAGREIPASGTEVRFLQTLVNRFDHHKNLIWCIAEEYSEANSQSNVQQIARIIREADNHDHVIAVHQLNGTMFDFPEDPNIDQFAMQINIEGSDAIHRKVVSAFEHANGRYNLIMSESDRHYAPVKPNRYATRKYSWATAMGGAGVMVYFKTDPLNVPEQILADQGRIAHFFNQINLTDLTPHNELLQENDHVFVAANPGQEYILYFKDGSPAHLDLSDNDGDFNASWYNPRTGKEQNHNMVKGGTTIPFKAPTPSKDWVLLLQNNRRKQ